MIRFEENKKYELRFIGDSDLRPVFVCTKRTAKMATFEGKHETIKKKIKSHDGVEYVLAGSYSMAPSFRANKEA